MTDPSYGGELDYQTPVTCASTFCGGEIDKRVIFTSLSAYKGNLGGVSGANQICQGIAEQAGLRGLYHALLADQNESYEPLS